MYRAGEGGEKRGWGGGGGGWKAGAVTMTLMTDLQGQPNEITALEL